MSFRVKNGNEKNTVLQSVILDNEAKKDKEDETKNWENDTNVSNSKLIKCSNNN